MRYAFALCLLLAACGSSQTPVDASDTGSGPDIADVGADASAPDTAPPTDAQADAADAPVDIAAADAALDAPDAATDAAAPTARLRFASLSDSGLDLCARGTRVSAAGAMEVGAYLDLAPGPGDLVVVPTGASCASTPVASLAGVTFAVGTWTTVVAFGPGQVVAFGDRDPASQPRIAPPAVRVFAAHPSASFRWDFELASSPGAGLTLFHNILRGQLGRRADSDAQGYWSTAAASGTFSAYGSCVDADGCSTAVTQTSRAAFASGALETIFIVQRADGMPGQLWCFDNYPAVSGHTDCQLY